MNFNNYIFIYRDPHGFYHTATNPRFIANYTKCVAIPKEMIDKSSFNTYTDFVHELSNSSSEEVLNIITATDLKEIYIHIKS